MIKPMYDKAFRCETVQHINESVQTVTDVARELKINHDKVHGSPIIRCPFNIMC